MILLAVLGVLGVMVVLILNLSADASFAAHLLQRQLDHDRAYYAAASATVHGLDLLRTQKDGAVTLLDPWAQEQPPIQIGDHVVRLRIVDEERFFNPNTLVDANGREDADHVRVFRRLLFLLGQREDFCNALLDWLDSDATKREPGGAESLDYGDRRAKNGPLDSVDEIDQILGVTGPLMNGQEARAQQLPGLRDLLSTEAGRTLNVNTAEPFMLRAMAPDLDDSTVRAIVQRRTQKPFRGIEDLLDVPGVTRDHLFYLRKTGGVTSQQWRIESVAERPDVPDAVRIRVVGTWRREAKGFRPLTWKVGEVGEAASPAPR